MKVLILGANGMLGHKLYQVLSPVTDLLGTIRGNYSDISMYGIFRESSIIPNVNVLDIDNVRTVIAETNPDVIINCVGIVKQVKEAQDRMLSIQVNSLLPHQLFQLCHSRKIRLIHISTDCVFSGEKGNYREDDPSDAQDIYGRTKYLGEVIGEEALTIRTSLIGRELTTTNGLVEWFISNRGSEVNGFTRAIFSGFPTLHLARIIGDIITNQKTLSGIYHISSEPISKFELLNLINEKMGLQIKINVDSGVRCDRSLDSTRYRKETGFHPFTWNRMLDEFTTDALQYERWRR